MAKKVDRNQALAIVATLMNNVDWDQLDGDVLQTNFIADPKAAKFHATAFFKAGARMPLSDMHVATAFFDIKKFLGKSWKIDTDKRDTRSAELMEVDFSKVDFLTCLKKGEPRITGEEKFFRLKRDEKIIRHGSTVFWGLWLDYQVKKWVSVLEHLYQDKGITYLDFFGDILLHSSHGTLSVLYLYRDDNGAWRWNYDWIGHNWDVNRLSVVSQQVP